MLKLSIFTFVDLTQVRSQESLNRKIDRLFNGDGNPFPPHYSLIRKGISQFCFPGFSPDILDNMHEHVMTSTTSSEFTIMDKSNCLLAIELMRTMPVPVLKGITFEKGEKITLPIGGIVLQVVTDATLSWVDTYGNRHLGAIKAKVKKGNFPRELSEMTSCLIAQAMKTKHPDAIIDPIHCYCLDVFRQRFVPANNLLHNLGLALEIAERIASRGDLAT